MRVGTHDGFFHADELMALATLRLCGISLEVVRTRDAQLLAACDLRVDVGMNYDPERGDYDHHQRGGAGRRDSGVPYAAFGLVWQNYGLRACEGNRLLAESLDAGLVSFVDANDSGYQLFESPSRATLAGVDRLLSQLNPAWDEVDHGFCFSQALDWAERILRTEIANAAAELRAAAVVRAALERSGDDPLLELPRPLPWQAVVVEGAPQVQMVLFPRPDSWALQAVPQQRHGFETRMAFPEAWAGKTDAELVDACGVSDAVFCHRGRFFAVARSRDGALQMARLAIEEAL